MTTYERRKIEDALATTLRFIDKEGKRNPELRPADVQKTLDFYITHAAKLQTMLATTSPAAKGLDL